MDKSLFLLFALVATVSCNEDVIHLLATKENQNLTSPSLEGISRPHDFRWRIWLNSTEEYAHIWVTLLYLNVPERTNCSGSYIEIIMGNYSFGRECTDSSNGPFTSSGPYMDITYHIGTENGTHEFQMSYYEMPLEPPCSCFFGFPFFILVTAIIAAITLICVITTCCCVYRHCRKGHRNVTRNNGDSSETEKGPAFVNMGPPSYDDAIKGDGKPPPYTSVVDCA